MTRQSIFEKSDFRAAIKVRRKAQTLFEQGMFEDALKSFNEAIQIYKDFPDSKKNQRKLRSMKKTMKFIQTIIVVRNTRNVTR